MYESDVLDSLDKLLDEDLRRFRSRTKQNDGRKQRLTSEQVKQQREFIKYLISVTTHPIGLRASVSPFNSSQDYMLAYIMDMFAVSESKLKSMFADDEILNFKKRHSWRPELRIRLNAPRFFYKQKTYLDSLNVRVYLFKQEQKKAEPLEGKSSSGLLQSIFSRLKLDSSSLIRPVNELRHLIKFKPVASASGRSAARQDKSRYRMIQLNGERLISQDDIHLPIRRYYCELETAHILRFEFWLTTGQTDKAFLARCRRYARVLVHDGCYNLCKTSNPEKTTYMDEDKQFYGYINIKLTQIPSYPVKCNYPILNLKERKVNNCEVCLSFKNRRIETDTNKPKGDNVTDLTKKSIDEFIINHMRIYASFTLYQCQNLDLSLPETFDNITFDNLFYLPAFTLINQHRLHSNLSLFEDQCLRRVSLLVLLMKLVDQETNTTNYSVEKLKSLISSMLRNDYMMSRTTIDQKTMQEINPFSDDPFSSSQGKLVAELESAVVKKFVESHLEPGLRNCFVRANKCRHLNRSFTLMSLKLIKSAISYLKRLKQNGRTKSEYVQLESQLERLLCEIIINHLSNRLEDTIRCDATKSVGLFDAGCNVWLQLMSEIKYIDHDLNLYWSPGGLNRLIRDNENYVKTLNLLEHLKMHKVSNMIMKKIDNYLR